MARKKKETKEFTGEITTRMLAVWLFASIPENYDFRLTLATLQFYNKSGLGDGMLVYGTNALVVTDEMAGQILGK